MAIDNGNVDVAATILDDDEWRDALCNDHRWTPERASEKEFMTPMRKLIKTFPSLAQEVLDRCCVIRENVSEGGRGRKRERT